MNFGDLQEQCWVALGLYDSQFRLDWRTQMIRDAINTSVDEICNAAPQLTRLTREGSIAVVSGTGDYTLDDWMRRMTSVWLEETGGRIDLPTPARADREGWRSGQVGNLNTAAGGQWALTLLPKTSVALASLTGPTTVTQGSTVITWATAVIGTPAAVVGKLLRLNGEAQDYLITAASSDGTSVTLDRPVVSRRKGIATLDLGSDYTSPLVEISPPGRCRVRFLPVPQTNATVWHRYVVTPRRLLAVTDVPAVDDDFHHLVWKGALKYINGIDADDARYARYVAEFMDTLQRLKRQDANDGLASHDQPAIMTNLEGPSVDRFGRTGPQGAPGGSNWQ